MIMYKVLTYLIDLNAFIIAMILKSKKIVVVLLMIKQSLNLIIIWFSLLLVLSK